VEFPQPQTFEELMHMHDGTLWASVSFGIDIEPRYCDLACQRITDAYAQPDLFLTPTRTSSPRQEVLL
jgi:hypothetical protein